MVLPDTLQQRKEYLRQHLPWERLLDELKRERYAHRYTAQRLRRLIERLRIRDGTSRASSKLCLLCHDVPLGRNPLTYRAECPHHWLEKAVLEHTRLSEHINVFLKHLADGAVETTPPPEMELSQQTGA